MTQRSTCGLVLQGLCIVVSRHFGTIRYLAHNSSVHPEQKR